MKFRKPIPELRLSLPEHIMLSLAGIFKSWRITATPDAVYASRQWLLSRRLVNHFRIKPSTLTQRGVLVVLLIHFQQAHLRKAMGGKQRRAKFIGKLHHEAALVRERLYAEWLP